MAEYGPARAGDILARILQTLPAALIGTAFTLAIPLVIIWIVP